MKLIYSREEVRRRLLSQTGRGIIAMLNERGEEEGGGGGEKEEQTDVRSLDVK